MTAMPRHVLSLIAAGLRHAGEPDTARLFLASVRHARRTVAAHGVLLNDDKDDEIYGLVRKHFNHTRLRRAVQRALTSLNVDFERRDAVETAYGRRAIIDEKGAYYYGLATGLILAACRDKTSRRTRPSKSARS